ncbi:MAG: hypothetical protein QNJ77_07190 [Acidimicrobiia bacterium]|nr:hypothetical protein [Acidimicrobiia bacterium]
MAREDQSDNPTAISTNRAAKRDDTNPTLGRPCPHLPDIAFKLHVEQADAPLDIAG